MIAIIFVLVVTISNSVVQGKSIECPQICPLIFMPTCGTDKSGSYKHFPNPCTLNAFNCNQKQGAIRTFEATDLDWCTTAEVEEFNSEYAMELESASSKCLKPCPMVLDPICGSNGIHRMSFSNECDMEIYNCVAQTKNRNTWKPLKAGRCSK